MKKILLIDGNSLFFRAFYANQYSNLSFNGTPTNGVYTFANLLLSFLTRSEYFDVRIAFDKGKQTFRHQMYADYKEGRQKTPDNLIAQLPLVREFVNATGIGYVEMDEFEADDIVGTYAKKAESEGFHVDIISSDKDLWQLVSKNINILSPISGVKDYSIITPEVIKEKWDIEPKQVVDLKGIMGDSSDNIKGVPGIGEVGALKLLKTYGTVENVYTHIDEISGAIKTKLVDGKESAFFSKKLATLKTDIDFKDDHFKEMTINYSDLETFFKKYNMISLIKKYCLEGFLEQGEFNFVDEIGFDKVTFKKVNYIYFEILNDDYHMPNIIGVGFYNGENTYYISVENPELDIFNWNKQVVSKRLQDALTDGKTLFETYDVKKTIFALEKMGYRVNYDQFIFDTKSALYVVNPEAGLTPETQISILSNGSYIESDEDIFGKGVKRTANIDSQKKKTYVAKKTHTLAVAKDTIIKKLKEQNQYDLYFEIDHKLNFVLLDMEKSGVAIDSAELSNQTDRVLKLVQQVETSIYNILGVNGADLNLASPKQLKTLLFETLKLPDLHKGSTDKEALEGLANEHPVINLLLEHRKLQKLYTTYLAGFKKFIHNGKVHSKFNQNLTATGRLSSSDPNLQNISIRDEMQREVRKIFVASDSQKLFIGLDYSQIELRVLAQMANEHQMLAMFDAGQDIHEAAARRINNLSDDDPVSSDMRRIAKVFNFGIIYGLSDYGLSRDLKISLAKAKEYINNYFATFSDLKEFKDHLISMAKEKKYGETMSHRRRYVSQLNDANKMVRNFGERIAVNMPIQGTAADIIKVAMVNIWTTLKEQNLKSKMVAQIHDELIFEVEKAELETVKKIVQEKMKSALSDMITILKLSETPKVKLAVSYSEGKNWLELK